MRPRRLNRDIVERYYSVLCFDDVAEEFGTGWYRVMSIVAGDKTAGQSDARGAKVLLEMRDSNDLGRKWPVVNVIDSLQLNTRTRSGLFIYYPARSPLSGMPPPGAPPPRCPSCRRSGCRANPPHKGRP